MRRAVFAAAIVAIFAVNVANAACYGPVTFQNCDDSSGTGYTINHFGDTTMMTGGDAQTGGSWAQNSTTFGDTTFHNDRASSGNSWNATDQRLENSAISSPAIAKATAPVGSAASWTGVN